MKVDIGSTRKSVSRISRFGVLLLALGALAAMPRFAWASVILPALSPYVMLISTISLRAFTWISLLALPATLLAFWRGRWFCRYACPAGLCLDAAGKIGILSGIARKGSLRFRPGRLLLLLCLGGAITGFPLFLWLDPLVLFNGFATACLPPYTISGLTLGAGFLMLLLISFVRPDQWCLGICPLGAAQQELGNIGRRFKAWRRQPSPFCRKTEQSIVSPGRRALLALLTGAVSGLCIHRLYSQKLQVIRPPGSAPESQFDALCARCGNCMRSCPENIIYPAGLEAGPEGILTPVVRMLPGFCSEFCNRCNTVCPTGAIAILPLVEKQNVRMGTAVVTHNACLAWAESEYCMACEEYCPYKAIDSVIHHGVDCPVVDADRCRGCGRCQKECPAFITAINVHPAAQKRLAPVQEAQRFTQQRSGRMALPKML